MLDDDWRDWFRSWSLPGTFAHPDSPAGGAGTGFSRPPGPRGHSWPSSRAPHPNSPAARHFDWHSELLRKEGEERDDLARQFEELEDCLAKHSDSLRDTLPDDSLRTIYDRQVAQIKGASGFATGVRSAGFDLPALLRKLQIALDPFDLQVHRSSYQRTGLEDILGRASIVWEYGTLQEKKDLLKDIQTLAGRVCGAAKSSIQEEWAEAKRTHKEDALLGEWKTRSLQRSTHAGSGVAEDEPRRSEARPAATAMSKNTGDRIEPDKQKVHWVEIRLVPLPDAAPRKNWWRPAQAVTYAQEPFTAEVTDGQKDSALGGGASARYDNIPGGTCSWTFTRFFDQIEKAFKPGSR